MSGARWVGARGFFRGMPGGERRLPITGLLGAALWCAVAGLPATVEAQSAGEIVGRMLDEYARHTEGIDNYTVVQEVMGLETVSYFEKEIMDGRPVFRLRRTSANGMDVASPTEGGVDEIYTMGEELQRRATYLGQERIDDYDVHVLDVPDLSGTGFGRNVTPDSEFTPTSGRLFIDIDTYAPRRMMFDGEMVNPQGVSTVSITIDMGDYRETGGLLLAYRTVIRIEGLGAAIDSETRAQFEEMRRELENMPPEQRAMIESMMAAQLDQFQAMMSDESAPMVVEVMVTDVLVNEGPPR